MTPRQADVAFVLESVPGVRAVYAINPRSVVAPHYEFAIEVEDDRKFTVSAHYALLRVRSHEDFPSVRWLIEGRYVPPTLAAALMPLTITQEDRVAARDRMTVRARVLAAEPVLRIEWSDEPPNVDPAPGVVASCGRILVIASSEQVLARVRESYGPVVEVVRVSRVDYGIYLANTDDYDVILCDATQFFAGVAGGLSESSHGRVIVLADEQWWFEAITRARHRGRVLRKPIVHQQLRDCVCGVVPGGLPKGSPKRSEAVPATFALPVVRRVQNGTGEVEEPPSEAAMGRLLFAPPKSALRLLLVDIDVGIRETVATMFGRAQIACSASCEAVSLAVNEAFHAILTSASDALATSGFLAAAAKTDPGGAKRIVVVVPDADRGFVERELRARGYNNRVFGLPLDEVLFRELVVRAAPRAGEEMALGELPVAPPKRASPPRYRRLSMLVVDDEVSTQILFSAGAASASADADIALVTTPMAAFEHLLTRAVDVLVISTTMRSDGGEPFYRVLWRMKPELKASSVLLTGLDHAPASPRIVSRPLSRAALADVVSRALR